MSKGPETVVKVSEKAETLKNLIGMHERQSQTEKRVERLEKRVDVLEKTNTSEHRAINNQVKRTLWEMAQLAIGHRKDIEDHSHRITDTKERIDELQKIVNWAIYTVIGLFITTILAAVFKFALHIE